jgi:hypothetical protein
VSGKDEIFPSYQPFVNMKLLNGTQSFRGCKGQGICCCLQAENQSQHLIFLEVISIKVYDVEQRVLGMLGPTNTCRLHKCHSTNIDRANWINFRHVIKMTNEIGWEANGVSQCPELCA